MYAAALTEGPSIPRWLLWLARAVTLGLAVLYVVRPDLVRGGSPALPTVWEMLDRRIVLAWAAGAARAAAIETVRWVPIGLFARLALGWRPRWIARVGLGWAPALTVVGLVAAVCSFRDATAMGLLDAGTALVGGLVGVWAGSALLGGRRALKWFVPKLGGAVLVLAVVAAGLGHFALTPGQPAIDEEPPSGTDRVRLAEMARAPKDAAGLRTLRLTGGDIGHLIAWRWPPDDRPWRVRVTFVADRALLELSTPFPLGGRTLATSALLGGSIRRGALKLELQALQVGKVGVPVALARPFFRRVVDRARSDPDVRRLLTNAESARVTDSGVELRGRRPALDQGLVARLAGVGAPRTTSLPDLSAHLANLLAAAESAGSGDVLFVALVRSGFAFARARSASGDPVEESRAALLALSLVLGHTRLEQLMGRVLDDATRRTAREITARASMRDRHDWSRHFTVSAALALLGAPDLSDMGGVLKEELDSQGGSGFSFGDLLADRAGTTLAATATRDRQTASRLQERLAAGVLAEDLLPDPTGLVEGLDAEELAARYGGVDGAAYRAVVADIEARIAELAIYRQ